MPDGNAQSHQMHQQSKGSLKTPRFDHVKSSHANSECQEMPIVGSSAQRSSVMNRGAPVDPGVESHVPCKSIGQDSSGEEAQNAWKNWEP